MSRHGDALGLAPTLQCSSAMLRETAVIASDRRVLYGWIREPIGTPRGIVAHVHGMGEHSRRYDHLAAFWEAHGYVAAGFDQRGHGRSQGRRGHTRSYGQLLDDVATFLENIEDRWGDLPITLYGHSMGGNVVLNYAVRREPSPASVIASAPYLRLANEPRASKMRLVRALRYLAPAATLHTGLQIAALSRDPDVIDAFRADPLVHDHITTTFFAEIHAAAVAALASAREVRRPTLLMHGDADRITCPSASVAYVNRAAGRAALKLWDGFYHELHNEPQWRDVASYVLGWIDRNNPDKGHE